MGDVSIDSSKIISRISLRLSGGLNHIYMIEIFNICLVQSLSNLNEEWLKEFVKLHPEIQIRSGIGLRNLKF